MTDIVISLPRFGDQARQVAEFLGCEVLFYHKGVFKKAFSEYRRIVAVMSMGIVFRSVAPLITDKWEDPAVVVVSPDLGFAIPVIGGHHGGNDLARALSGLQIIPVVTTATETAGRSAVEVMAKDMDYAVLNRDSTREVNAAILDGDAGVFAAPRPSVVIAGPGVSVLMKDGEYSMGIGCRKDIDSDQVLAAIRSAMADSGISAEEIMIYATTEKKMHEKGLKEAVDAMDGTLLFLDDMILSAYPPVSPSEAGRIGIAGVAEPCALASSRRKELVLQKRVYGGVTIAIAR